MDLCIKRILDVVLALILGVLLSPLFLLIVLALKATSPGPLLFRQERLAKGGSTFLMNKFRKFPANMGNQGPGVTLQFDSRMTRVGRLLERTKLDELPQLWNIFLGEMSFVGPRPESLKFRHLFRENFAAVLNYTPGIFGPNQTKYRNESAMYPTDEDPHVFYEQVLFPDKARNDLAYFQKATLVTDLWCIVSGLFALVFTAVIWRKSMKTSMIMLGWDVFSVLAAWVLTHWLKYSVVSRSALKPNVVDVFSAGFIVLPLALIVVFAVFRIYRHPVRYFSGTDSYRLTGASCLAWIMAAVTFGLTVTSTSSLLIAVGCLVSIFLMVLPRVAYKEWHSLGSISRRRKLDNNQINILVCGITDQSLALCNLLKNGYSSVNVIGILTEDDDQLRREIHGFEVVGRAADLEALDARYTLNQIWVASPLAPSTKLLIDNWCGRSRIPLIALNSLPGFSSLVQNQSANEEYAAPADLGLDVRKPIGGKRQDTEAVA